MEKITHKYLVSQSYKQFHQKLKQRRGPMQSLPAQVIQNYELVRTPSHVKQNNMFVANADERLRNLNLQIQKPYEYVGLRQMKEFLVKAQKKKKVHHGSGKFSFLSTFQSSQYGFKVRQKCNVLTKEELMKRINHCKTQPVQQIYLSDQHSTMNHYASNIQLTQNTTTNQVNTLPLKNIRSQQGALKNIKNSMQKYSKLWNKQITDRQNGSGNAISQRKHLRKINSSLLNDSTNYRQFREKQQKLNILEHVNNAQPREWGSILRKKAFLQKLHNKTIEHICSNGWKINGSSKLQRQIDWVEKKDSEGYFFKTPRLSYDNKGC